MKVETHFFHESFNIYGQTHITNVQNDIINKLNINDDEDFVFIYNIRTKNNLYTNGHFKLYNDVIIGEIRCLLYSMFYTKKLSIEGYRLLRRIYDIIGNENKKDTFRGTLEKFLYNPNETTDTDYDFIKTNLYTKEKISKLKEFDFMNDLKETAENKHSIRNNNDIGPIYVYVIRNLHSEYIFHQAVSNVHSIEDVNVLEKLLSTMNSK